MASEGPERRLGELALLLACVLALGLIAVALSGTVGPFAPDDPDDPIGPDEDPVDRATLVGGGSIGDANVNPIGAGVGNQSNPFQNTSDEVQFRVETDTPGYWRVDGYDNYSDGEWHRTGTASEYRGGIDALGPTTDTTAHNVTLARDAAALPATWQPGMIDPTDESAMIVSPETGVGMISPKPAEDTYSVQSYCYAPTVEQLHGADDDYPVSIEERYTTLPDDIPDRVPALADDITADDESQIAAAQSIGDWLADNTTYSLEATHDPGADPIDDFLFEQQAGNAEYYASSTVMLLRSQDIPARYVTGYAPGEIDEQGTVTVRGIHAHAWVEIYVPGHGWIPFDPTPTEDRIAVENSFLATDGEMLDVPIAGDCADPDEDDPSWTGTDEDPPDNVTNGTNGENGDENGTNGENGDNGDNGDNGNGHVDDTPEDIDIVLSDSEPTPGQEITVTVTRDDKPVEGATVSFNGDPIGETAANGEVVGTVPYTETLEISVELDTENETTAIRPIGTVGPEGLGAGTADTLRLNQVTNASLTIPLTAEVDIAADPEPVVIGGEVQLQALINEIPMPEAEVLLDGEPVATTDEDGWATFTVPEDAESGPGAITVRRGDIAAQQPVTKGELRLTPSSESVLAIPGQDLTVLTTVGTEPVEGVELSRNGEVVATSDANGTATIPMTAALSTTIEASYAGQTRTVAVENQLLPVLVGTGALVLLVGGVVGLFAYRPGIGHNARTRIGWRVNWLFGRLLNAVGWMESRTGDLRNRMNGRSPTWVAGLPGAAFQRLLGISPRTLLVGLQGFFGAIGDVLRTLLSPLTSHDLTTPKSGTDSPATSESTGTRQSIRRAWARFVRLVTRRADPTATPGEIRERAIAIGLPAGPVRRLTEAFRQTEYGPENTDPSVEDAAEALDEIEAAADHDPTDSSTDSPTDRNRPTGD